MTTLTLILLLTILLFSDDAGRVMVLGCKKTVPTERVTLDRYETVIMPEGYYPQPPRYLCRDFHGQLQNCRPDIEISRKKIHFNPETGRQYPVGPGEEISKVWQTWPAAVQSANLPQHAVEVSPVKVALLEKPGAVAVVEPAAIGVVVPTVVPTISPAISGALHNRLAAEVDSTNLEAMMMADQPMSLPPTINRPYYYQQPPLSSNIDGGEYVVMESDGLQVIKRLRPGSIIKEQIIEKPPSLNPRLSYKMPPNYYLSDTPNVWEMSMPDNPINPPWVF